MSTPAPLAVERLSAGYDRGTAIVEEASFTLHAGTVTGLIGPNGAGKSSLLRAMLGPDAWTAPMWTTGSVAFFGRDFASMRARVAFVPQRSEIDWAFPATALDVAAMGRYARLGLFRRVSRAARDAAREALRAVGLDDAQHAPVGELSGGQQQRVLVARALAQDAELLVLDEPYANIDATSAARIAAALRELASRGRTVLAVMHDLDAVREDCDDAILLNRRVVAHGAAREVLDDARLAAAYGIRPGAARA